MAGIELPTPFELEAHRLQGRGAELGRPLSEGDGYHDLGSVLIMCRIDLQLKPLLKMQD